jgi:hypothetical protein
MNMVYYGQHTPALDQSIIEAKPEYLIANTPHGLWSEMSGYNFFPGIAQYQKAGVKIIGYITAGYEGTHSGGNIGSEWFSLETNLELIKNMAERDQIDGVFIDECSSFPDLQSKAYLKALTSLATSLGLVTWGNVGVADFDSWFFTDGGFDLMHSNEDWHGQPLTAFQKEWAYRISVTGIFNDITAKRALELTTDARAKGLAYCYISVGYHSIPKWFEEYVALLRD